MASFNIYRSVSCRVCISTAVKYVTWIAVGGGGGGGYPNISGLPRPGFTSPQAGGTSSAAVVSAGGGGGGGIYSGGYGGYGNLARGSSGGSSSGPGSRARSGYGGTGQGGAGQWRGASSSYGGGGGGASLCCISRGSNGACPGQNVYVTVGYGGTQGGSGNCRYGYNGSVSACICTYDRPTPSISASPTAFRLNGTDGNNSRTTLSWTVGGGDSDSEVLDRVNEDGMFIETLGQVNRSSPEGGLVVAPTVTSGYRLTASNPAYEETDTVIITVYIPPVIDFTCDATEEDEDENDLILPRTVIVQGNSTTLRWTVTGDVDDVNITPGIGSSNLTGFSIISPTIDTEYTLDASGLGGTGSAQILVIVLQPPTISVTGPENIDYEDDIIVSISATNSDGGVSYIAEYLYTDGTNELKPSVAVPNTIGDEVTVIGHTIPIVYNDYGPFKVILTFLVDGFITGTDEDGDPVRLEETDSIEVPINIDRKPENIQVPETTGVLKDENPVITPGEDTTITLTITDIDIPVEIKADSPIQVEINDADGWQNIRKI